MSHPCQNSYRKTDRSKIDRMPKRGIYEKECAFAVIDQAPLCHLAFVQGGQPFVIPTIHVRVGERLYFHGANKSRLIEVIENGAPICMTFTLLDGLVVARSVVHNSMNYRSVVAFGKGEKIHDDEAKMNAFRNLSDKLLPGRWEDCKRPTQEEMDMTAVVSVTIEDASMKQRVGPPEGVEGDYGLPYWAGVLPLVRSYREAISDPRLGKRIEVPEYVKELYG